MKLKADFIKDWHDMLKDILENYWGLDISGINENDLPIEPLAKFIRIAG